MPAQPQWLLRLPEIVAELEQFELPIVDRAIFEKVFAVGRRRAIQLMHHFDGHQVGRTFVIDRRLLLDRLRIARSSASFGYEQTRRMKVVEELDRSIREIGRPRVAHGDIGCCGALRHIAVKRKIVVPLHYNRAGRMGRHVITVQRSDAGHRGVRLGH